MALDRTDTDLVLAIRAGDAEAFGTLFERWFDRVYDLAWNIVRNPETAADVAQDTFVAAWERIARLENPDAFGGWLLRIARNRALDRLEREARSRPHNHDIVTGLHDRGARDLTGSDRTLEPEEITASHDRDGLVRGAAVVLGEREASVLDLHLRHGLSPAEIADELGMTANNAHQVLFRMRKKLGDAIGAFVLFRRGQPACDELQRLLPADAEFETSTFELVERHRRSCAECTDRRAALVSPEQLFSAAPIMMAPLLLRSRVLEGLAHAGVPVSAPTPSVPTAAANENAASAETGNTAENPTPGDIADVAGRSDPATPDTAVANAAPEPEQPDSEVTQATDPDRDLLPEPVEYRSSKRPVAAIVGVAAVVIVVLAIATQPDAQPSGTLATPIDAAPIASDSSAAPTTVVDTAPIGTVQTTAAPETTIPDGIASETTNAPAADAAPTTQAPLAPTPPGTTPAVAQPPVAAPQPPPAAPPTVPTTPPTVATTAAPPPPEIIRLFTVALPPNQLICGSGSPYEFRWAATGATAATLTIGTTSRSVPALGPYAACGSSGQVVTLSITGSGGTDAASTTIS